MLKFSKTNKSVLLDERLMGEGGGAPAPCAPPGSATEVLIMIMKLKVNSSTFIMENKTANI